MTENEMIVEAFKKRFQQINEYIVGSTLTDEANDEPQQDNQDGQDMPPMDGGQGGPMPQGEDMGAGQGPEGFNPQVDATMDPNMQAPAENMEQPGDEVVDVTELTDSQKETEKEIEGMNNEFSKVLTAIEKFQELIKNNDEKIDDLKAEFEKRNPTQVEKLSMQTDKSYPFNIRPEDYWKEKTANSNYSTEPDNNGKEQGQYVITANDVNGDTNWKAISDSLSDDDFLYHQNIGNIFKI